MDLQGKKVLVVGLGLKTGVSAVKLLSKKGAVVAVADAKPEKELSLSLERLAGISFELHCGSLGASLAKGYDIILLSPGVPRTVPLITEAVELGIPVIGDIELAYRLLPNKFVGITGTDGKSTTTSMIGSILEVAQAGLIAGNIGFPVLDLVDMVDTLKVIALELSSFQLESIADFKPVVGAILNLAPDHLDRYPDMSSYLAAKLRLFENFDGDCTAVLPMDDVAYSQMVAAVPKISNVVTFAMANRKADFYIAGDQLMQGETPLMDLLALKVVGKHNRLNALAAAAICFALGIDTERIREGLAVYRGLAHRFEYAGDVNGVVFINDSKATTVSAVRTAIDSAGYGACVLMGGRDKGLNFAPLASKIAEKKISVFPFGEAAEKVKRELKSDSELYPNMESAMRAAWQVASIHDDGEVILAPGCTSYDEFPNFEVRGEMFKELVRRFEEEASQRG